MCLLFFMLRQILRQLLQKSYPFLLFFQKNANVGIFIEIQIILEKMCCYLHFSL